MVGLTGTRQSFLRRLHHALSHISTVLVRVTRIAKTLASSQTSKRTNRLSRSRQEEC